MYLVLSQDQLEEEGVPADEIEKKVAKKRTDLERKYGSGSYREGGKSNEGDSHVRAKVKEAENVRMAQAFGIRADHVEGCLFLPSCLVVSCRVVSCRVVLCRVVSCRVVSCLVLSCRVVSCLVLSFLVLSGRVVSQQKLRC
jgi:hypothetical protein